MKEVLLEAILLWILVAVGEFIFLYVFAIRDYFHPDPNHRDFVSKREFIMMLICYLSLVIMELLLTLFYEGE